MRFRLRTLVILTAVGPPLLAAAWIYNPPVDEFIGYLTFFGILSLAYWSVMNSGDERLMNQLKCGKTEAASERPDQE